MLTKIALRNVAADDLTLFFEHQRDPEAVAMVAFQPRERIAFAEHWAKLLADVTILKKTVLADDRVAGHVVSFNWEGQREIGYWIDRAFWGRGVATAAVAAFLRLERTRPLFGGVAPHNAASIRVLQKCGFTLLVSGDEPPTSNDDSHVRLILA